MSAGLNFDFGGGDSPEEIKPSEGGYGTFEDGEYIARIDKMEIKDTKAKEGVEQKASDGTPAQYFNVQWRLTENEKNNNRVLFQIVSIRFPKVALDDTENERKTREAFLGWLNNVTGTDFSGTNQKLNINNLIGAKAKLRVATRFNDYKQEKENYIVKVNPYGDGSVPTAADVRRSL